MKKHIYSISAGLLFSAFFLAFPSYYESSDWIQKTSLQTRDLFFRIRRWSSGAPDKAMNVVIIAINEESCEKLESRWPWSRRTFAVMIDHLRQAGARVVGLNVSFTGLESSDVDSTEFLAQAMKSHGNVVIGATFNKNNSMVRPNSLIAQAVSRYGYLEKIIDSDYVIRRSYVLRPYERTGEFESSFPLQVAAAAAGNSGIGNIKFDKDLGFVTTGDPHAGLTVDQGGAYAIDHTALGSDFKHISAWKIVQNKFNSADVR